jgi:hypothetical protein
MSRFKSAYVSGVRVLDRAANGVGVTRWLEARPDSRAALWGRSLFAIYDIDRMVGLDLPWWTFEAIDRVDAFLKARPSARVFEYGSGASTVWLGKRAAEVITVEHDASWSPVVAAQVASMPNVRLRLIPPDAADSFNPAYGSTKPGWRDKSFEAYVKAIDSETGQFDVIVIDGRARVACLEHAAGRLAPGGIIVFDNSKRAPYVAAIKRSGMSNTVFAGLTACLPYPDATTLLYQ